MALDAKGGKMLWKSKAIDVAEGYSMTVAPLVADGVVVTGISGGEYGTRRFVDGWNPADGAGAGHACTEAGAGKDRLPALWTALQPLSRLQHGQPRH